MNPAVDSVTVDPIRKYFRKAREYEQAYIEGKKTGKEVEAAVQRYKSHRRVFTENINCESSRKLYILITFLYFLNL